MSNTAPRTPMIIVAGKTGDGNSAPQVGTGEIIVVNSSSIADSGPLGRIIVITALFRNFKDDNCSDDNCSPQTGKGI
jgi:hypothetical protein